MIRFSDLWNFSLFTFHRKITNWLLVIRKRDKIKQKKNLRNSATRSKWRNSTKMQSSKAIFHSKLSASRRFFVRGQSYSKSREILHKPFHSLLQRSNRVSAFACTHAYMPFFLFVITPHHMISAHCFRQCCVSKL